MFKASCQKSKSHYVPPGTPSQETSVDVLAKDGVPHSLKTGSERDIVVISDLCSRTAVRKTVFLWVLRQNKFFFFVSIRVQRSLTHAVLTGTVCLHASADSRVRLLDPLMFGQFFFFLLICEYSIPIQPASCSLCCLALFGGHGMRAVKCGTQREFFCRSTFR